MGQVNCHYYQFYPQNPEKMEILKVTAKEYRRKVARKVIPIERRVKGRDLHVLTVRVGSWHRRDVNRIYLKLL